MAQAISVASFAILQLIFGLSQIIDASKGAAQVAGYAQRVAMLFAAVGLMGSSACSIPPPSPSSPSSPSRPPAPAAAPGPVSSSLQGQSVPHAGPPSPCPSQGDTGVTAEAKAGEQEPLQQAQQQMEQAQQQQAQQQQVQVQQQQVQQQQEVQPPPCVLAIRGLSVSVPRSSRGSPGGVGWSTNQEPAVLRGQVRGIAALTDVLPPGRHGHGSEGGLSPEAAVAPAGEVAEGTAGGRNLVTNLSVDLPVGHHLLVSGPSGCGKTSLLRVLRGMWLPAGRGTLCTDTDTDVAGRQDDDDNSRCGDRNDFFGNQGFDEGGRCCNGHANVASSSSNSNEGSFGDLCGGGGDGGGLIDRVSSRATAAGSATVSQGCNCDSLHDMDRQQNKKAQKKALISPSVEGAPCGGHRSCCAGESVRLPSPPVAPLHGLQLQLSLDAMFLTARPLFSRQASLAEQVVYPLTLSQAAAWLAATGERTSREGGRGTGTGMNAPERMQGRGPFQPFSSWIPRRSAIAPQLIHGQSHTLSEQPLLSALERVQQALETVGLKPGALHLHQFSGSLVSDEAAIMATEILCCHAFALKLLAWPREGTSWESVLSRGEQQRLQFARALFFSPSVVFLDEAVSAIDEHQRNKMLVSLISQGSSIVSVSHDVEGKESWPQIHLHLKGRQGGGGWAIMRRGE